MWQCESAPGGQVKSDVDHIICQDPQTNPAFDAVRSLVSGAIQPMPPFENADAPFATGAPFLGFLEPRLLLFLFAFLALGGTAGNTDSLHAQVLGLGFVGGREEACVGSRQIRSPAKQFLVLFD